MENLQNELTDADMIKSSAKVVIEALKIRYAEWRSRAVQLRNHNQLLLSVSDEMNETVINYIEGMLLAGLPETA